MAPEEFLRHPVRWLRMISRGRVAVSGGPDFAFGLCAARVGPEERAGLEVTELAGNRIAPVGTAGFNLAFDVTPAELITAIVTEEGVLSPPFGPAIAQLFN
jgi:methylthioribose-1-phosphate isomerase